MFANVQKGALDFYLAGATWAASRRAAPCHCCPSPSRTTPRSFAALDGTLGEVIRRELAEAGLHAFRHCWLNGFHHITTSNRPIRDADDFAGLKIRTPGGELAADFLRTLGAEPGMVPFSGMYEALKARTFDSQSDPLGVVQSLRLYEVQSYLSLTGHWWSGFTLLAHGAAWQALRARSRSSSSATPRISRSCSARMFRRDQRRGEAELARQGMVVNTTDTRASAPGSASSTRGGGRASTRPSGIWSRRSAIKPRRCER